MQNKASLYGFSMKDLPYYSQLFDVQAIRTRELSYIISYMDLKDSYIF